MSYPAVAAYLWELRKLRELTRKQLGLRAHVDDQRIYRWESSREQPLAEQFLRWCVAVGADPATVFLLMTSDAATPDDGRKLAADWAYRRSLATPDPPV